ncbi:hypothetical protein NHX12_006578, partial [Muraenolepis orangiensis]
MEELQVIKRELTLIKTQIDGLLDSLDKMDAQKNNHKGSPLREDSPAGSPYPPSASSPEQSLPPLSPPSSRHRVQRESPELGEATDDDHPSYLQGELESSARNLPLLSNLAMVKPDKAKAVENYLIQMARFGKLGGKITESGLIEILEKVSQQTEKKTTVT